MDEDIDALRQEVGELKRMTADTNRIVHKLRRNIWWGRIGTLVWWVAIFAVSGAAYYYYAQPYVNKAYQAYENFQQQAAQAQTWESQVGQFLQKLYNGAPAAPQVPTSSSTAQ